MGVQRVYGHLTEHLPRKMKKRDATDFGIETPSEQGYKLIITLNGIHNFTCYISSPQVLVCL